jgi:hypothetical protein
MEWDHGQGIDLQVSRVERDCYFAGIITVPHQPQAKSDHNDTYILLYWRSRKADFASPNVLCQFPSSTNYSLTLALPRSTFVSFSCRIRRAWGRRFICGNRNTKASQKLSCSRERNPEIDRFCPYTSPKRNTCSVIYGIFF